VSFVVVCQDSIKEPIAGLLKSQLSDGIVAIGGTTHEKPPPTAMLEVVGPDALTIDSASKHWLFGRKQHSCVIEVQPDQVTALFDSYPALGNWSLDFGLVDDAHGLTSEGPVWYIDFDTDCLYVSSRSPGLYDRACAMGAWNLSSGDCGPITLI